MSVIANGKNAARRDLAYVLGHLREVQKTIRAVLDDGLLAHAPSRQLLRDASTDCEDAANKIKRALPA